MKRTVGHRPTTEGYEVCNSFQIRYSQLIRQEAIIKTASKALQVKFERAVSKPVQ